VAREHQLHPTLIGRRQKQHRQYPDRAFAGNGRAYTDEARIAELERMVGRLTMENDLLKKPCSGSKRSHTGRQPMERSDAETGCPTTIERRAITCGLSIRDPGTATRHTLPSLRAPYPQTPTWSCVTTFNTSPCSGRNIATAVSRLNFAPGHHHQSQARPASDAQG
jgi:transposase